MLDFGLGEILLLGAVALIVLGPEKLPHTARMAGAWYGRIRRTLSTLQTEIENEVNLAEVRQRMNKELGKVRHVHDTLTHEMHELEHQTHPDSANSTSMIMNKKTDQSHGIEAPRKYHANNKFFFVSNSRYATLIPSAPRLPKSIVFKIVRAAAKQIDTKHLIDAAS